MIISRRRFLGYLGAIAGAAAFPFSRVAKGKIPPVAPAPIPGAPLLISKPTTTHIVYATEIKAAKEMMDNAMVDPLARYMEVTARQISDLLDQNIIEAFYETRV